MDEHTSSVKSLNPNHDPSKDSAVFSSVLYYCLLILCLPILSFFLTKLILLELIFQFDPASVSTNIISAVVAVIVLHLALGLFIWKAYFDTDPAKKRIGKQE